VLRRRPYPHESRVSSDVALCQGSPQQQEFRVSLNVVIGQGSRVIQFLDLEDQPLLFRWDGFDVLQLSLDGLHGVGGLHVQGHALAIANEFLDPDLVG
jgi:hypothetical protein